MGNGQKEAVKRELLAIFEDAFQHDGYSDFRVEMRILKRKQKEVIIHYGKQHRFVLDYHNQPQTDSSDMGEKLLLASVDS